VNVKKTKKFGKIRNNKKHQENICHQQTLYLSNYMLHHLQIIKIVQGHDGTSGGTRRRINIATLNSNSYLFSHFLALIHFIFVKMRRNLISQGLRVVNFEVRNLTFNEPTIIIK
jgi:hypothetical protein